jgi:hypothetical protein
VKHRHSGWHEHSMEDLGDATEPHTHRAATPADSPTTLWLDGTERADGYDPDQQLARRVERWLDDLVLHGALGTEDRRRIRLAFGATPADSLDALPTAHVWTEDEADAERREAATWPAPGPASFDALRAAFVAGLGDRISGRSPETGWDAAMQDPAFVASLNEGLADVAAGRTVPYTPADSLDALRALIPEAIEAMLDAQDTMSMSPGVSRTKSIERLQRSRLALRAALRAGRRSPRPGTPEAVGWTPGDGPPDERAADADRGSISKADSPQMDADSLDALRDGLLIESTMTDWTHGFNAGVRALYAALRTGQRSPRNDEPEPRFDPRDATANDGSATPDWQSGSSKPEAEKP